MILSCLFCYLWNAKCYKKAFTLNYYTYFKVEIVFYLADIMKNGDLKADHSDKKKRKGVC